jgi:uncharacterized protein (TIRG00374 family)
MKFLRIALVLLILLCFGLFLRNMDLHKAADSLRQLGHRFIWLLLATFAGYFFATVGWRFCMGITGNRLSLRKLFLIRQVGEAVSVINPTNAVGGEAMKMYLLRNTSVSQATLLTAALVSRTLMVIAQALLFLVTTGALKGLSFPLPAVLTGLYIWFLPVTAIVLLVKYRRFLTGLLVRTRWGEKLVHRAGSAGTGMEKAWTDLQVYFRNSPKAMLIALLFFVLYWVVDSMELLLILHFLGIEVSVLQAVMANTGVGFYKAAAGFIPGQIGVEEYANKVMLDAIGVPGGEIWLVVSLIRRTRQLCWIVFGLLIYVIRYKNED